MTRITALIGMIFLGSGFVFGDEANDVPRSISMEVTIVDAVTSKIGDRATPEERLARIRELQNESGGIESLSQFRMQLVEKMPCSLQFGQQVPVVTGQSAGFNRGNAPRTINAVRYEQVGTMLHCLARIQDDTVVLELEAEESKVKRQEAEQADGLPLSATFTMTIKSTLVIPDGKTVIAGERVAISDGESRTTIVLVTAAAGHGR